jgi:hypothetical protein
LDKKKLRGQHRPFTLGDELGDRRSLQHVQVSLADGLPEIVDGTRIHLGALGPAEDAAGPAANVLDRLDDIEQADVARVACQAEAAAEALLRFDQAASASVLSSLPR